MLQAAEFVDAAASRGVDWYAGVPCSFLTPFINYVIDEPRLTYLSAANEGDAVAAAAGAYIGGRFGVAMMQNSGLGNAVSPLTSLTHTFGIPMLVVCTHRGAPGVHDEPQHELMGQITGALFDAMRIPWEVFPRSAEEVGPVLDRAFAYFEAKARPYALVMQKGSVAPHVLNTRGMPLARSTPAVIGAAFETGQPATCTRQDALRAVIDATPVDRTVLIASTGYTGRELYALADRPNQLYMVGSMGCASSLGLGLAMARPDLQVVVIDGDGAALMRMGNLATLGTYGPSNLCHVLLDNQAHDSTGAQATVSGNVDFATVARACGYAYAARGDADSTIPIMLAARADGPRFLHLRIRTGTRDDLPRPTITPPEVLRRLMRHCGSVR